VAGIKAAKVRDKKGNTGVVWKPFREGTYKLLIRFSLVSGFHIRSSTEDVISVVAKKGRRPPADSRRRSPAPSTATSGTELANKQGIRVSRCVVFPFS